VQKLASVQTLATAVQPATTALGGGTLHIELGTWGTGQTSFTAKAGATAVDVTVAATDTLADVRDKINASGAGVTALVMTDSSGSRLLIRSNATGVVNGFRTSVTDADGSNTDAGGLSALAYVANWHFIASGQAYIQQFFAQVPSPLRHTWSLAIEEQFYLFWPVLLVGVFWLVRRRQPRRHRDSGGALRLLLALTILASVSIACAQTKAESKQTKAETAKTAKATINNPAIDMKGYLEVAGEAAQHRESRERHLT
jgi:hypothetical protein